MKCLFLCLLTFSLAACDPVSKEDDDSGPSPKSQTAIRTATPTPIPQPGDWMEKKKNARPPDMDSGPLKTDPLKTDPLKSKSIRVKGDRLGEKAK